MRSIMPEMNRPTLATVAALAGLLTGCSHLENHWVEDGPASREALDTPTVRQVSSMTSEPAVRQRGWAAASLRGEDPGVTHFPLYFEDPFVDKGHGRQGVNVYHGGWEDFVAMPYGLARHTVNWMFLPVSMIVTPPCTVMESDGELSEQKLGYDHDATQAAPGATEQPHPLDEKAPSGESPPE